MTGDEQQDSGHACLGKPASNGGISVINDHSPTLLLGDFDYLK